MTKALALTGHEPIHYRVTASLLSLALTYEHRSATSTLDTGQRRAARWRFKRSLPMPLFHPAVADAPSVEQRKSGSIRLFKE
jgi:hypothetical protein